MEHQIKAIVEATINHHLKGILEANLKELRLNEETKHLTLYVNNAAPLHELKGPLDDALKAALESVYGDTVETYEVKIHGEIPHERDKRVPHNINQ